MMRRYQLFLLPLYFLWNALSVSAQQTAAFQPASTSSNASFQPFSSSAEPPNDALLKDSGWSYHLQFTGILQAHPTFSAPYSGENSLTTKSERAYSVTTTLYLGRKLWQGATLYLDRKSTRLNSSHYGLSRMPSSA